MAPDNSRRYHHSAVDYGTETRAEPIKKEARGRINTLIFRYIFLSYNDLFTL